MGQKALIWLMIVGVAAMMASGLVLMLRADVSLEWAGFARFVHVLFFVLITVTLILHVYLATHPINRAGLHAMFGSGEIDAEVVRRNHPLWWKKLTSK
jgi:formate dehydrogenase subunit gamma